MPSAHVSCRTSLAWCALCVPACSVSYGAAFAVDGVIRSSVRSSYARALGTATFFDPYTTMTIVLAERTPNIAAVKVWQSDSVNTDGVTTNITVWLHEFGQPDSVGIPNGNQRAFLTGVVCTTGMWPTPGAASQPEWRLGRCNQTIGAPGALYVTLQKFHDWVTYTTTYFYVAEVQILADGESWRMSAAAPYGMHAALCGLHLVRLTGLAGCLVHFLPNNQSCHTASMHPPGAYKYKYWPALMPTHLRCAPGAWCSGCHGVPRMSDAGECHRWHLPSKRTRRCQ